MSVFKLMKSPFSNTLIIKQYKIFTNKITVGKSVRIVLVTDLHSNPLDNKQKNISKLIEQVKPDVIALAGDIADADKPIDGAVQFMREISGIAPIYYVTGNHECHSQKYKEITEAFKSCNAVVLTNEYKEITVNSVDLIIGGVDDPDVVMYEQLELDWNKKMIDCFSDLKDKPQYKILLSHRPELVDVYKLTSFDMILSGHAHGGQVRIPYLLNGLFAPHQGFFPKYAGGMYRYNDITHIVSRGISYDPHIPRIFNPPELVVIDVVGG